MDKPLAVPETKPTDGSAVVAAPYVDPFQAMYADKAPEFASIAARGSFSCQIFAELVHVHTAKKLNDTTEPQLELGTMKILAKQAVFGADLILAELASTNNRRV